MKTKMRHCILLILAITILSCEKSKELETNIDEMSVDFSDGLDKSERETIHKAQKIIINACTVTGGKYDFSNITPSDLGISEELFEYIRVNYGYLNTKIEAGVYKLQDNKLLTVYDGESSLKSRPANMQMMAVTATDGDNPNDKNGGGGQFLYEVFEQATDWYKVYEADGYAVYEYTNTTYKYRYERVWVDNPYVYNMGGNRFVYYHGSSGGGSSSIGNRTFPIPVVIEDESFKNTKADCLKEELEKGGAESILNKLLDGFKLDKSNIDIVYKVEDKVISSTSGKEINGVCRFEQITSDSYKSTIILSQNRMNSQSFLETARTLLHETFHAHLFGMTVDEDLYNSLGEADFNDVWEQYKLTHPNETQHNWMADNYIKYMKEGLEKIYNNWDERKRTRFENYVNDVEYGNDRDLMFTCLAWQGLLGKDHNKTVEGAKFYQENGAKYDAVHQYVISMLTKNCPF